MFSRQFVRSFSASAKRAAAQPAKDVKPPVQLYGLDGTYATALYTASAKGNSLPKSASSISKLAKTIQDDPKVKLIMGNPSLSEQSRSEIVTVLAKQLSLDPLVKNLLEALAENNRLALFPDVAKQFEVLNAAANGLVEARVVSAKALDSKVIQRLTKAIAASKYVGQGKTLKIENEVDPSILGGLIIEIGDKSVDLSVQTKTTKLNKVLTETI